MAFNTGNPLGSTDPRDFSDNSENLDRAVNNAASATWTDRFGNSRTTLAGQVGYTGTGAGGAIESYAAGLVLSTYNTIILYSGEFYRPSSSATLPYTTTATTPDVDSNLVAVGDAVLRQDLANSTAGVGSDLVAHTGTSDTVTEALDKRTIYVGSVAELEAFPASVGMRIETKEYISGTGIGANAYEIVAGGTGTDDGGSFIDLNNGLQAKGLFPDGMIYLSRFGGDATGTGDSSSHYLAALNYSDIVVIDGDYRITSITVPTGKMTTGSGKFKGSLLVNSAVQGAITISDTSHFIGVEFKPVGDSPTCLYGELLSDVLVSRCIFDLSGFTGTFTGYSDESRCIDFRQASNVEISHCKFKDGWTDKAFNASSPGGNNVQRCISIENLGESHVKIYRNEFDNIWTAAACANVNDLEISFNKVYPATADTAFFDRCTSGVTRRKKINFNEIKDAGKGAIKILDSNNLTAKGHQGEVIGNQIDGYGIFESTEAIFSKNYFDFGVTNQYMKAPDADRATDLVVSGNQIRNIGGTSTPLGLTNLKRVKVFGNTIECNSTTGAQTFFQWCAPMSFVDNGVNISGYIQLFSCDRFNVSDNDIVESDFMRHDLSGSSGQIGGITGNTIQNTGTPTSVFGFGIIAGGGVIGSLVVEGNTFITTIASQDNNTVGSINMLGVTDAANAANVIADNNIAVFSDVSLKQKTLFGELLNPFYFVGNRGSVVYDDATRILTIRPTNARDTTDTITFDD